MLLLLALVTGVALAAMAYSGIGTRPLYIAGMLIALVGAAGCNAVIPSQIEIRQSSDEAFRTGGQFLFE